MVVVPSYLTHMIAVSFTHKRDKAIMLLVAVEWDLKGSFGPWIDRQECHQFAEHHWSSMQVTIHRNINNPAHDSLIQLRTPSHNLEISIITKQPVTLPGG